MQMLEEKCEVQWINSLPQHSTDYQAGHISFTAWASPTRPSDLQTNSHL